MEKPLIFNVALSMLRESSSALPLLKGFLMDKGDYPVGHRFPDIPVIVNLVAVT
jgi:hypothetical protein